MPLQKLSLKPGVNQENTRYTNEGGWYESDKIRFRQGTPESIGGWTQYASVTYQGVCRSLNVWVPSLGSTLIGIATNLKMYLMQNQTLYDITPIRLTATLGTDPFAVVSGSATVTVTHTANGALTNDFVTFSGATAVGGLTLNGEYQVVTVTSTDTYLINAGSSANATTSGGGAAVSAAYQLNTGSAVQGAQYGWGAGYWGSSTWGNSVRGLAAAPRQWSQANYGNDLVFGPMDGGIYYWENALGVTARGTALTAAVGASDVPTVQHALLVSDVSRFVIAFGCNELGASAQDPMLIRWSDQENAPVWTPSATNQAGGIRLSIGSEIRAAVQTRQEILVWTDAAMYSMQFLGAPLVWGTTLLDSSTTFPTRNGAVSVAGVVYWIGIGKFYMYDGRVQVLPCDLRKYVFDDYNNAQVAQTFAASNEQFNEVWWFYCSAESTTVDKYVVYNYVEKVWYYGTMARTAWVTSGVLQHPIATGYNSNVLQHEDGVDDGELTTAVPINSYIVSAQFDVQDGHNFSFVWRMLPDMTFKGSTTGTSPSVVMTLLPLQNSGSGYTSPASVGGSATATVSRIGAYTVDQFTGQVNTRVRARQMSLRVEANTVGTAWQLGSPRIDVRNDGRR